ncbi:MAG: signal recognition particle-docking protein FtsY [Deltaproteobacteria bacterium]|nr:signal recognition particle-docking protein FtsY [Deltaproteobacteria bacterium]
MRRWFRRRDKDRQRSQEEEPAREEGEAPVEAEEPSEAAAEPTASEEAEPSPPQVSEEEGSPAAPEARPGFFRRMFGAPKIEEDLPPAPEAEALPEGEPSPAPEPPLEVSMEGAAAIPLETPTPPETAETEIAAEPPETPEAARKGLFRRFRERLNRTRDALAGGLDRLFAGRKVIDEALLEELEELLITADLGVDTALHLIQGLRGRVKRRELGDVERLKAALHEEMAALLQSPPPPERAAQPWVVLLVGVNGVGKTTTIAKLAHQDRQRGLTPLLIAADTFRAAAVEQLEIWGQRAGAQVIKQKHGADPAAVVFDGLAAAQARGVDTVYIDTAGRLQTKVNLMEELKKIHRTAARKLSGAPHEIFLVLDATTGQNALSQARLFHEAVGLTGIILTKMDGTAKGGVALAVAHETGIPLRYLGVGEGMDDLRPFDAEAFVAAILGEGE